MIEYLKKLFCRHKWDSHAKEKYEWEEKNIVKGTEIWTNPMVETIEYSVIQEVLICSKCGEIKSIEY